MHATRKSIYRHTVDMFYGIFEQYFLNNTNLKDTFPELCVPRILLSYNVFILASNCTLFPLYELIVEDKILLNPLFAMERKVMFIIDMFALKLRPLENNKHCLHIFTHRR